MKKEAKRNVGTFHVALLLTAYAALTLIGTSRAVHAQTPTPTPTPAWTQIGANISNTNPGNVGIGTAAPSDILHVRKDQNTPTQIRVKNVTAGGDANTDIILENDAGDLMALSQRSSAMTHYGALAYRQSYIYTNSPPGFAVMSDNPVGPVIFAVGGNAERMLVAANGNVGIGTNNAQAKLDVVGNINVTGNINAKYQDIAEWVPSRQKLSAGTVVILDPDKSSHRLFRAL